jgi:type II secretory pathway pseudopilin PulG
MGQQQLLLLVLGIVIVGIAVVAGIQAFSEGRLKAQRDAAVSDAMRIISDTQAWMLKPAAFGGPSTQNNDVSWQAIGFPTSSLTDGNYTTTNGCFTLDGSATGGVTLGVYAGSGIADGETTVTCDEAIATVTINGPNSDDITWVYDGV